MNKKVTIIVLIIVVIIMSACLYYLKARAPSVTENVSNNTVEKGQSTVGAEVGNTNPFNVDVSPYQGYKNPFE